MVGFPLTMRPQSTTVIRVSVVSIVPFAVSGMSQIDRFIEKFSIRTFLFFESKTQSLINNSQKKWVLASLNKPDASIILFTFHCLYSKFKSCGWMPFKIYTKQSCMINNICVCYPQLSNQRTIHHTIARIFFLYTASSHFSVSKAYIRHILVLFTEISILFPHPLHTYAKYICDGN